MSENTAPENPAREQAQERNLSEGIQFEPPEGGTITANPASDSKRPEASSYVARTNADGSKDTTMLVDKDGNLLNEASDEEKAKRERGED